MPVPPSNAQQRARAVLWDLDGTLLDSAQYHWEAWRDALAAEGVDLTYEHFLQHFGQRNDVTIPAYLRRPVAADELRRISNTKEEHYREMVRQRGIELLPGVEQWLERLKTGGWKQVIASSAPRPNIEVIVDTLRIRPYFHAIVSAEDVRHGKPDPEIFLNAASKAAVPPARCVVVEDAPAGVEAAKRAACRVIAVLTSHQELHADVVVRTLDDLPSNAFDELVPGA